MIEMEREKMMKKNRMKSYNEYDVEYWLEDYNNDSKQNVVKLDREIKKMLNHSDVRKIDINNRSIYEQYIRD
jgi:hypothetical protein